MYHLLKWKSSRREPKGPCSLVQYMANHKASQVSNKEVISHINVTKTSLVL